MTSTIKCILCLASIAVATALPAAEPTRLLHDRAHGETPLAAPMKHIAEKFGLAYADSQSPITPEVLSGVSLLYLRAPSKEFTEQEQKSIIDYVKAGGSLLLVLDEEVRQSLDITKVNTIISPFGLKLTPDLPYLHNCGGIALAGLINSADREIPYSGGRAVEGGTPFAYVLNKEGKPSEVFAAHTTLPNGAKIVVMGEGMASLFLGTREGVRFTGVPHDFANTTYWGKDSALFMEELIAWMIKK